MILVGHAALDREVRSGAVELESYDGAWESRDGRRGGIAEGRRIGRLPSGYRCWEHRDEQVGHRRPRGGQDGAQQARS